MKMFKKLMAVVLTGVMAISMLTGCAITDKLVSDAVKKAVSSIGNGASVTVVTKSDDRKDVNAAKKTITTWVKNNEKTALTQDIVDEETGEDYEYILVEAKTSSNKITESMDPAAKAALAVALNKDNKVKVAVSDTFDAYYKDGSSSKKSYVLFQITEVK